MDSDGCNAHAAFSTLASLARGLPRGFHERLGVLEGQPFTFFCPTNGALAALTDALGTTRSSALLRNSTNLDRLMRCVARPAPQHAGC